MFDARAARRALLGRDVATAYAAIVGLYLVRHLGFQPVQIPAYLFIVGYDFVELGLPAISPYHPVGFPLFLYLLAVLGAGVARWARAGPTPGFDARRAVGGVCVVVAMLAFLFAGIVRGPIVSPADNPTPLAITGLTGVIFAAAAWWLLRGRSDPDPDG